MVREEELSKKKHKYVETMEFIRGYAFLLGGEYDRMEVGPTYSTKGPTCSGGKI